MFIGFVLWVGLSILIGKWNTSRGNSFAIGFICSLLLSPIIGALIVLLQGENSQAKESMALQNGMKKCPSCAELIREEAKKCKHCVYMFK